MGPVWLNISRGGSAQWVTGNRVQEYFPVDFIDETINQRLTIIAERSTGKLGWYTLQALHSDDYPIVCERRFITNYFAGEHRNVSYTLLPTIPTNRHLGVDGCTEQDRVYGAYKLYHVYFQSHA